jgi:hypothetical protein
VIRVNTKFTIDLLTLLLVNVVVMTCICIIYDFRLGRRPSWLSEAVTGLVASSRAVAAERRVGQPQELEVALKVDDADAAGEQAKRQLKLSNVNLI